VLVGDFLHGQGTMTGAQKCGSYDLRLVARINEDTGEMAVVLVCKKCRQREMLAVR
jgi:hypothetical protein